jgi:hypothetical protein
VIADQGEVGDLQPAAEIVEEAELGLAGVLHVVPDERDEIRPDQVVDLAHHPVRDPRVLEVRLG